MDGLFCIVSTDVTGAMILSPVAHMVMSSDQVTPAVKLAEQDQFAEHLSPAKLTAFYAVWVSNPDAVSEDEFFAVQMHLLVCADCAEVAHTCERQELANLSSCRAA